MPANFSFLSLKCNKEKFFKTVSFIIVFSLTFLICTSTFSKKPSRSKEEKTYEWPQIPDKFLLEKASGLKSQNGLVVLEKRSQINIGGIFAWLSGAPSVVKEEFIRFLIIDQNGVKNAEADIETIAISKVEEVDARTVLPDGKILNIDKEKDLQMVELETLKRKNILFSAGKVRFPSPQVGAILDIHYKVTSNAFVLSWLEPLVYNKMPTMKLNIKITISDIGIGWQVITLNTNKSDILKLVKSGEVELNITDILPADEEPLSPPPYNHQPYVFAFSNLLGKEVAKSVPGSWSGEIALDDYWLPNIRDIDSTPFKPYWSNFLEEIKKEKTTFLKDGKNQRIDFVSSDITQLPIIERAKKLFSLVEDTVFIKAENSQSKYQYYGKKPTLVQSLKDGFEGKNEIAFFISYLYDRYQIPYQDGVIMDRSSLRFSPFIPNAYIFKPVYAIKVLGEGSKSVFVTGDKYIPFGTLDSNFQNSIFIYKDSNGKICSEKTPENAPGSDFKRFVYEFNFNDDLSYKGKIILEEGGSCANELAEYLQKSIRIEKESKKKKKTKETDISEEIEKREKLVKSELEFTNKKMSIESFNIVHIPTNSKETLKIEYNFIGSIAKESVGDLILVYPIPFLGEQTSPFLEEKRHLPVWFPDKEVQEFEGTLIFPKSFVIEDIPQNESFYPQNDFLLSFELQKSQSENANILKVKFKITNPLFASTKNYNIVKQFYSLISKTLNNKILIRKNSNVQ